MADEKSHTYDVFLSFRGEDTRKNFTEQLYNALKDSGVDVFRDDEELNRGEDISMELEKSIEGSRISVIFFSKNYAGSRWCLEELVKIMECRRSRNQVVLPIFYGVNPCDVRNQEGSYGEAFARHEEYFDIDRVIGCRMVLREAGNLSDDWCLRNIEHRNETEFIKLIVEEISMKLSNTHSFAALNLVAIDSGVKALTSLLAVGSDEVKMVGIWGMGGIGKTTIAKAVYNEFGSNFEATSFLANVNEISKQPNGLLHLQEQLLSNLLDSFKVEVQSIVHGINLFRERLRQKRVLIVLDDIDHIEQLNALAKNREWFGSGSRIIITTRDKHLLTYLKADASYRVEGLNDSEALELFSWHAFRSTYPSEVHSKLSKSVVNCCGGLPLALEVLGSFLFGRSISEWENTLEKLKTIPYDLQEKLRISYECLSDRTYKDIFLDISCRLDGMDRNDVVHVLERRRFSPKNGISVLIQRCLLRIDEENKIMMPGIIRDMGKNIVREESLKELLCKN